MHIYIYIYIYGAPPHVSFLCCSLPYYLFSGAIGEHCLVLVVYLMRCVLVLLVLWEMGEHYLMLIRGPAGIGSNTGLDRRSKIEDAWKIAPSKPTIFVSP